MPKNVYLPENFPKIEEIREIKNEIPTYEEFLKNYNVDEKVSDSYENEIRSYSDISSPKVYGPMYWTSAEDDVFAPPSIRNVSFSTTGSTKYDNYRVVGTVFGGLIGNLIGGAIEDRSMRIPKGILFASYMSSPLSWTSFYRTATMNRLPSTSRVDYHDDKINCSSRDRLIELRNKIGDIVEIWDFGTFSSQNRSSKERDFKDKVQDLLDKHSEGEDINGSYTIY